MADPILPADDELSRILAEADASPPQYGAEEARRRKEREQHETAVEPEHRTFGANAVQAFQNASRSLGQQIIAGPALVEAGIRRFVGPTPSHTDPTPLGAYLEVRRRNAEGEARMQEYAPRTGVAGVVEEAVTGAAGSLPQVIPALGAGRMVTATAQTLGAPLSRLGLLASSPMAAQASLAGAQTTATEMQDDPTNPLNALAQGVIEGAFTRIGGASGTEAYANSAREAAATSWGIIKDFLGNTVAEYPEEALTSMVQEGARQLLVTGKFDPSTITRQGVVGGAAGSLIAGGTGSAAAVDQYRRNTQSEANFDRAIAEAAQRQAALAAPLSAPTAEVLADQSIAEMAGAGFTPETTDPMAVPPADQTGEPEEAPSIPPVAEMPVEVPGEAPQEVPGTAPVEDPGEAPQAVDDPAALDKEIAALDAEYARTRNPGLIVPRAQLVQRRAKADMLAKAGETGMTLMSHQFKREQAAVENRPEVATAEREAIDKIIARDPGKPTGLKKPAAPIPVNPSTDPEIDALERVVNDPAATPEAKRAAGERLGAIITGEAENPNIVRSMDEPGEAEQPMDPRKRAWLDSTKTDLMTSRGIAPISPTASTAEREAFYNRLVKDAQERAGGYRIVAELRDGGTDAAFLNGIAEKLSRTPKPRTNWSGGNLDSWSMYEPGEQPERDPGLEKFRKRVAQRALKNSRHDLLPEIRKAATPAELRRLAGSPAPKVQPASTNRPEPVISNAPAPVVPMREKADAVPAPRREGDEAMPEDMARKQYAAVEAKLTALEAELAAMDAAERAREAERALTPQAPGKDTAAEQARLESEATAARAKREVALQRQAALRKQIAERRAAEDTRPVGEVRGVVEAEQAQDAPRVQAQAVPPEATPPLSPEAPLRPQEPGRNPTEQEKHEAALELDKATFRQALQLRVEFPTNPAGEFVRLAPLSDGRKLKPRVVVEVTSGEQLTYAPPAFAIGRLEGGAHAGKYAVFMVKPRYFEKANATVISAGSMPILVPRVKAATPELAGKMRELANARAVAQQAIDAEQPGNEAFLRATTEGETINREIEDLVGAKFRSVKAPYWLAVSAEDARSIVKHPGVLTNFLYPTFEAAHEASLRVQEQNWKAVSNADASVTEEGTAATVESAGEEGEGGNAGFGGEARDLEGLDREPSRFETMTPEEKAKEAAELQQNPRAGERIGELRKMNARNPAHRDEALRKWDELNQTHVRAARAYIHRISRDDAVSAWYAAALRGDKDHMARAARAMKELEGQYRTIVGDKPEKRLSAGEQAAEDAAKARAANPFLQLTGRKHGGLYQAFKDLPAVEGVGYLPTAGLQYAVRLAQAYNPGITFSVGLDTSLRGGRTEFDETGAPTDLTLNFDAEGYAKSPDGLDRHEAERKFVGTIPHEWYHSLMAQPGINTAVNTALRSVMGDAGMARLVEGARASFIRGKADTRNYVWEDVWRRKRDYYNGAVVPTEEMKRYKTAEAYADAKVVEEITAFAVTMTMRDGLFTTDEGKDGFGLALAKAIFTHPAMGVHLDEKALISRLGVEAAQTKTGLAFVNAHLAKMSAWLDQIARTPEQMEAERARDEAMDQTGTVSEDYKAGQETPENRPSVARVYLDPVVRERINDLAEVVTAAIRYQSGRVVAYRMIDGKQEAVVNTTWTPETPMGKAAFAELEKLGPQFWAQLNRGHRTKRAAMDEPGDGYTEESADDATNARKQEFLKYLREKMEGERHKGAPPAKPPTLRERFTAAKEHTRKAGTTFGTQYRELGLARTMPEAITAQNLDQYYNRAVQGRAKSENAIRDIAAPMLEAKAQGATKAQLDEAYNAFGDYAVLRDVQEAVERGKLDKTFIPGKTRIPLMNQGETWTHGTDEALFTRAVTDARQRMLTNPIASAMFARYDAMFEALRAEATRLGVADELSAYYYHRQVLMFTTPEAKERRQKMMDALSMDTASVARATGAILKERGQSLADFNLNIWESLDEAVLVFDRLLARAELSNNTVQQVSRHNEVAQNIQDANREATLKALATTEDPDVEQLGQEFTAKGEHHVRIFQFFGSLLNSDHTIADRPWVEGHRAVLEKIKEAYKPTHSATEISRAVSTAATPAQYRALVIDALRDSPPIFQQMMERVTLGGQYLEPFDFAKAYLLKPALFPEGYQPAPVPFKPPQPDFVSQFAGAGDTYATIARRVMASMGHAAVAPQVVLPERVARELGHERTEREKGINARTYGAWATARKVSVIAQLSTPLTIPRYLMMNLLGNTLVMGFHDPASLGYIFAAQRLLYKYYKRPATLTPSERLLIKTMEREHLLASGLGAEFRTSNNPLMRELSMLTTYQEEKSLPAKWWDKTWGKWERMVSPHRKFVDDFSRVAMFMREVEKDSYLSSAMGDAVQVGMPGRAWSAIWNRMKGESGLAKTRQHASALLEAVERTGDPLDDLQHGRRVAQSAAARVQGSLGNYGALSRFGESKLGRGLVNVFHGYTDNIVRQTITALVNDLSHPSLAGKTKGAARGLLLLATGPLLIRMLNAMFHDDEEDEDYRAFLENPRSSPWFDLYLGSWGGKPRVLGISGVLGDVLRPLGFGQIDKDIAAAVEYAGTDDWATIVKTGKQVLGQQLAYLFDPQIAYLDMVPTAAGYRWNAKEMKFNPTYDTGRQLLQPWGLAGAYDAAYYKTSGQTVGGFLSDTMTRAIDPEGGVINRAKAAVARFNEAQGIGTGKASITVNEEARMRNSLRQALLHGDAELAQSLVAELYNIENRAVGPDNLLKSFGASSVYHALGSDGVSDRKQMREKLHRWLPPGERENLQRADALQERVFNPWLNPQLKQLLLDNATTPDLRFRTARVLANSLNTAVAETRTELKNAVGRDVAKEKAMKLVATDLGLPIKTVMRADDLRALIRDINAAKDRPALQEKLRARYLRLATEAGFTR